MRKLLFPLFLSLSFFAFAQDIPIDTGWKFKTGDQPGWSSPALNDSDWSAIKIGLAWEDQGYDHYDGFAWYRLHIVIPSSIRAKAFLKEQLRFDLGKIDDGDEVYLNGSLIGSNAGRPVDIKHGPYDVQRSYILPLSDPRIHWDKENIIAVRVWDGGGNGGMWEGKYGISMVDVTDYVTINNSDNPFQFGPDKKLSKKIMLVSSNERYDFTGKLQILVRDPASGSQVLKQTIGTDFSKDRPFEYTWHAVLPENKSYEVVYSFEEGRSRKMITLTEQTPYVLTPVVQTKPRINGPTVFGVRPGSPFLYRIPVSGAKPVSYDVVGLPAGLHLDKTTGIITGVLAAKASYKVKLLARNNAGEASRNFSIVCGDATALTPALGWNSWNCWGLSVSDEKVRAAARAMNEKLADHGWSYVNIDDGWEDKRDAQGVILPNAKFPDMKALADFVHGLGLRIGIYSSPGTLTCGGYMGSYQHEEQDANSYATWGIDYLKYDWCSYSKIAPQQPSLDDYKKPYFIMRDALKKTNRDILFSLCQYGMGDVWKWGPEVGGNSWRTTGDITDTWSSLSGIGFSQDQSAPYIQPGHFNDPDMLVVGKVGWGPNLHNSRLTPDEQYTHISLWSLLSAPLLIGCDMSQLDDFTLNLLTNDEVLAVDQDALAKPAVKVYQKDHFQVWTKELEDGSKAVGIFNLADQPAQQLIRFPDIKANHRLRLRDLWRQKDLGVFTDSFPANVPAHGVLLLKIKTAS
ncbi:MAG TPA: putative Ig domain-containing protein [Puia sp.]|nr:putative Ig domain-containing protein [Puia sp.]